MAEALTVCTSGRRIPGLVELHKPCGHVLATVGYTLRKNLPVVACPACDAVGQMRAQRA